MNKYMAAMGIALSLVLVSCGGGGESLTGL